MTLPAGWSAQLDVSYLDASDPRQALDLYLPPPTTTSAESPLLVFIHGGAWRSESKSDLLLTTKLLPRLISSFPSTPIVFIEYRLAPKHPHPAQIDDLVSALSLLQSPSFHPGAFDKNRLYLVGHSAGACLAAQLALSLRGAQLHGVKGIVGLEGIFDLPDLLEEYPDYASFVGEAFTLDPDILRSKSPSRLPLPLTGIVSMPNFLVLHSKGDELLSFRQPRGFVEHLRQLRVPCEVDEETLTGGHWGVLEGEELAARLRKWVTRCENKHT